MQLDQNCTKSMRNIIFILKTWLFSKLHNITYRSTDHGQL